MSRATISEPPTYAEDRAFESELRDILESHAEFKSDSELDAAVDELRSVYLTERISKN